MRRSRLLSCVFWSVVPSISAAVIAGCEDSSPGNFNLNPNFGDAGFGFDSGKSDTGPTVDGKPVADLAGTSIDFGPADCGSTPAARSLTFRNAGNAPLTWSATITGPFTISSGQNGSVAPGESATITIAADAIPSTAHVGGVIEGSLSVTTNALPAPVAVPIKVTAHGASLRVLTSNVGFGQIPLGSSPATQELTIKNDGDRDATIVFGASSVADFAATYTGAPAAVTVAGGASLPGAIARFTPSAAGTKSAKIAVTMTGPLCAGDTGELNLSGEGTLLPVQITPGTVQFGETACGSTAGDGTVKIENSYNFDLTYTAAITTGPYALAQGDASGTIPANGSKTLTIHATTVPQAAASLAANALAGTMTISTSAPESTPTTINLAQSATGAVLTLTPSAGSTLSFGTVSFKTPATEYFRVKNTGNAPAVLNVSVSGAGYSASLPNGNTIAADSVSVDGSVVQSGALVGERNGILSISTTTPLCQASNPLGQMSLTALVDGPIATIGELPEMTSYCGLQSEGSYGFTITNTGTSTLVISSADVTGGFDVSTQFPISIAVGDSADIHVYPPEAVIGTDVGGDVKTGVLTLHTNGGATTVNLSATVVGASLRLVDGAGAPTTTLMLSSASGCPTQKQIFIENIGNASASVYNVGGWTQPARWGLFSPSSDVGAGETIAQYIVPYIFSSCSQSGTITYSAEGPVCSMPLALTVIVNVAGSSSCFCS